MDIEEELFGLQQVVNNFRIAGDGIIGGFGESALRTGQSYTVEERIDDLERRVGDFQLQGIADVSLSGTLDDGYQANA